MYSYVRHMVARTNSLPVPLRHDGKQHTLTLGPVVVLLFQIACPGGLVSILAYTKHPGGTEEYETVRNILSGLPTIPWTTSEVKLLNRSGAPMLLLAWKDPGS